jgi:2,4-dienoyl-CoA reductase-like NADH-dependent reductase (Old Yellow Enzyme family)
MARLFEPLLIGDLRLDNRIVIGRARISMMARSDLLH